MRLPWALSLGNQIVSKMKRNFKISVEKASVLVSKKSCLSQPTFLGPKMCLDPHSFFKLRQRGFYNPKCRSVGWSLEKNSVEKFQYEGNIPGK